MINLRMLVLEGLAHEVAEALGKGAVVNEEGVVFGVDELFFARMPGEGGNDAVDVGVVLELAAPGVEDAGEAAYSAVGFGGGDVAQGLGALLKDGVVEFFGVGQAGAAQFFGQCEGDHEVGHGE